MSTKERITAPNLLKSPSAQLPTNFSICKFILFCLTVLYHWSSGYSFFFFFQLLMVSELRIHLHVICELIFFCGSSYFDWNWWESKLFMRYCDLGCLAFAALQLHLKQRLCVERETQKKEKWTLSFDPYVSLGFVDEVLSLFYSS